MSKSHILEYIINTYSMYDLLEKLEPYISMEDFVDSMQNLIDEYFHEAFAEELEEYYLDE